MNAADDPSPADKAAAPHGGSAPGSLRLVMTLGGIAMISGLLVAMTSQVTKEPIKRNRREALEKAVFRVLPQATSRRSFRLSEQGLEVLPEERESEANLYAGYGADGKLAGIAMEASARGYQDVVKILYGYSPESRCITGMTVLQSSETPGLGDRVETDPDFQANFDALDASLDSAGVGLANAIVTVKHGNKTHPWQIDAISGATVTSAAIGTALNESASQQLPLLHRHEDALPPNDSSNRSTKP